MLRKVVLSICAVTLAVIGAVAASPTTAEAATTPTVIIVPGQSFGPTPYLPMKSALERQGYRVVVLDVAGLDIAKDATVVRSAVNRERARSARSPIALVGHSVGGLSARYYLSVLGGAPKVATYVAIGTAQYGSPGACSQTGTAHEVCPGSAMLARLNKGVNAVGPTTYYSIRSAKEWADGRLTGKQCRTLVPSVTGNGGFDHTLEPFDPSVTAKVASALAGRCTGTWGNDAPGSIKAAQTLYPNGR